MKKDGECNDHLRKRKLFFVSGKVAYDANRSPENAISSGNLTVVVF